MEKLETKKVEYTVSKLVGQYYEDQTHKGFHHGWVNREGSESPKYSLLETEDGRMLKVKCERIRFLDRPDN